MNEATRHRIYQMEAAPPPGAWDQIARELDASDIGAPYRHTLAGMRVPPPARSWEKIEAALGQPAPSTPVRRMRPWLRYAAAAVLLAALAWGGTLVFNRGGESNEVADVQKPVPVRNEVPAIVKEEKEEPALTPQQQDARDEAALEASKKTYAKLDKNSTQKKIRNAAGFAFSLDRPSPIASAEDMDPANRYIVLMTPDGHVIRMSKKWSDLLCCVSGEEQDAECLDQLGKWREKMGRPSQTASPANFGDILELVRKLQE